MNFTREIKRDLLKKLSGRECCMRAALFGLFSASGTLRGEDVVFTTESEEVAAFAVAACEKLYGERPELTRAVFDPKQGRDKLSFALKGGVLRDFGNFTRDCCAASFLSGAFLGGGSCTLPKEGKKTGYHLEVVFEWEKSAELFAELCGRFQLLPPGLISRKGRTVAYFKSRDAISDFLAVSGAESALNTLEEISAAREESNLENRKGNCFAGNMDKAAIASAAQVLAIEQLQKSGILGRLPEELKETALARLSNPELTLGELARKLSLSKSCLYHRLKKLTSLAGART